MRTNGTDIRRTASSTRLIIKVFDAFFDIVIIDWTEAFFRSVYSPSIKGYLCHFLVEMLRSVKAKEVGERKVVEGKKPRRVVPLILHWQRINSKQE